MLKLCYAAASAGTIKKDSNLFSNTFVSIIIEVAGWNGKIMK